MEEIITAENEKDLYYEYIFSFKLECSEDGASKVLSKIYKHLRETDWAYSELKAIKNPLRKYTRI